MAFRDDPFSTKPFSEVKGPMSASNYGATPQELRITPTGPLQQQYGADIISRNDAPALSIPWCFFAMSMVLIAFMDEAVLSYIAFGTCLLTSIWFMALSNGPGWRILAVVCFSASILGFGVGLVSRLFFEGTIADLYTLAILVAWTLMPLFLGQFLRRCLCPLTAQTPGPPQWNAKVFEMIRATWWYPSDYAPKVKRNIQQRLIRGDCYWTGEVIQDYLFYVCNNHTYIGPLACHPLHPYEWWERLIIAVCVCLLIVFPVSVFSQAIHNPMQRMLVLLAVATIPRNAIRWYFLRMNMSISQLQLDKGLDDDIMRLYFDGTMEEVDEDVQKAVIWEWVTIVFTLLSTAAVVVISVGYLNHHRRGDSMYEILARNCDGLGFAFVLELAFDLLLPRRSQDPNSGLCIGFFHAWYRERQHIEEQARRMQKESLLKKRIHSMEEAAKNCC
jgi:hypothetical protein